ncbi:DUF4190 domain-containing protein [Kitasatospora sp. NPDC058965]|uniref:DUF4190 domain-containing protein n=1 Tax=Kitasatospora sp. NPDC058965 TaxID=3346682 RepID=UPI0036D04BF1
MTAEQEQPAGGPQDLAPEGAGGEHPDRARPQPPQDAPPHDVHPPQDAAPQPPQPPQDPYGQPAPAPAPYPPYQTVPGAPPQPQPYPAPYPPAGGYPPYGAQSAGGYPPYGAQPPGGYPGYPAWPAPPPMPPGTNGLAIGALVTSLTCFLWPVGLGLAIGALNQIRRRGGQRGTGLAVAALVLSIVGAFATLGQLGKHANSDFSLNGGSGGDGTVAARDLLTGDCFDRAGNLVRKVPCSGAHDGEVVGSLQLTGSAYPDEAERRRQAGPLCERYSRDYSMDDWAVPDGMVVHYFYPERDGWDSGERTTTCFLTEPGKQHTGSMRLDVRNTTSAQYRYLKAMDAIDEEGSRRPTGAVADDPAGYREWAAAMVKVLQDQTAALQGGWDPAVGPAVDAQLTELKLRLPALQRAAQPTGPDDLARALAESDKHRGYDQQKAVRKLLGLSTDDSWLDQPSGGSDGAPKSV